LARSIAAQCDSDITRVNLDGKRYIENIANIRLNVCFVFYRCDQENRYQDCCSDFTRKRPGKW
jgi:hypothetical protein